MDRIKWLAYIIALTAILLFGTIGSYILGSRGGFNVGKMSYSEALYFTVVTISTVGYGDIYPITYGARIFVMVLIAVGLAIFLSFITLLSSDLMNRRIESLSDRISFASKRRLKGHVVLVGTSGVNMSVAEKLKANNEKFIIVAQEESMLDRLNIAGYRGYIADPTSEVEMSQFNLNMAKEIIINLHDPSQSLFAILVIRRLAKEVRTLIVTQSHEQAKALNELGLWRKESLVNPNSIAAENIFASLK